MSGHSKWAQIKRQKGVADARRSSVFSKLANAVTIAARHGTDPETNFQLRLAIDKAKAANMPKDNIERAIDRVKNAGGSGLEEVSFEVYGPSGTAYIIEAATDNHNRTIGNIRAALNKYGGKLAESGSVSYLFKKRGVLVLEPTNLDEAELQAIDAGAEDFETEDNKLIVYTDPKNLEKVRENLTTNGLAPSEVSLEFHPTATIHITDPGEAKKVLNLSEALDDIDDVTEVFSNFEINPDVLS